MKRKILILCALLLIALLLRMYNLDDKETGTDENWTITMTQQIVDGTFWAKVGTHADQPLFFMILAPFWYVSNNSILFMRILMVIFSVGVIFLTYLLAKRLFTEKVALLTVTLSAFAPFHLIYSHHIRVYIFLMLISLVSILLLLSYIKQRKNSTLIFLTMTYIILFYLHIFTSFFIIAQFIFLFLAKYLKLVKLQWKPILISGIITAIAWLGYLPTFVKQYRFNITEGGITALYKLQPLHIPYPFYKYTVGIDVSAALRQNFSAIILSCVLGIIFIYGYYKLYKASKVHFLLLALIQFFTVFALQFIGIFFPVFSFRYVSYLMPIFLVMLAYGFSQIHSKKIRIALIALTLIIWISILSLYWQDFVQYKWGYAFAI